MLKSENVLMICVQDKLDQVAERIEFMWSKRHFSDVFEQIGQWEGMLDEYVAASPYADLFVPEAQAGQGDGDGRIIFE